MGRRREMTDDLKEWEADFPEDIERAMAEDIALQCGEIYDADPIQPSDADQGL